MSAPAARHGDGKPIDGGRSGVLDALRERQARASDPASSIWVSANAGSGKTHVLTQRVIRLLLAGVPPARILCLTFTKAAAAQMSTRVFERLAGWVSKSDAELRRAIAETGSPPPTPADLVLARRLFTRAVETPGGLKIQTIHAFCERLLHLFPFESNVPARFSVADELRTAELMVTAKRAAIDAAQRGGGADGRALAAVAAASGPAGIDGLVGEALAALVAARRGQAGRPGAAETRDAADGDGARLAARLGSRFPSPDAVREAMLRGGLAPARWPVLAAILEEHGGKSDAAQAARLREAARLAGAEATREQALAVYAAVFFGERKKRDRLVTKAVEQAAPEAAAALAAEQLRLAALADALKAAEAVERTAALFRLVGDTKRRYERLKIAGGLLDFDDLIERTLALLRRSDAGWVLHKLDSGIDHVLVDEAQDTSEAQWQILELLTGDFAAGAGAREDGEGNLGGSGRRGGLPARSFFVVGDDKQSIFSFQGAAPAMFDMMRLSFERRFRAAAKPFERVALKTSFRSAPGILDTVDRVFELGSHGDGLVRRPEDWPRHESFKASLPGLVEVWPRVKAQGVSDADEWTIPLDVAGERDPATVTADRVAAKIKALLAPDGGEWVHERDGDGAVRRRPIRAGDVLILVRTRSSFFEAVIRALKRERIPVAGADRLDVANHIAVLDLVAAGRAALLPADDLSLACVLKSPLFGFTDDDLIALCPRRAGTLFAALAASPDERHRRAHDTLGRWGERAVGATPFTFYIELLGRDGGRRLMEARLGGEAHDAIDEFLRLALDHERLGAPSLGAFLADVEALSTTVKRDMEGAGAAVRVMTVHAAKGLEAKVVFLPDTCGVPAASFDPCVFDLAEEGGAPLLVWSPARRDDPEPVERARAAERDAAMREYRRLLYVALTRAEERLYIAGFFGAREPPDDCWNAMIERTLDAYPHEEAPAFWDPAETVRRFRAPGREGEAERLAEEASEQGRFALPPDWLFKPVGRLPSPDVLRPSHVADGASRLGGMAGSMAGGPGGGFSDGRSYGTAVHELLQLLPARPCGDRDAAGRAHLEARALPPALRVRALDEAMAVIAHPDLAALFGEGSRAEVALAGCLVGSDGMERNVPGRIDRLVATPEAVIVADFKTGAPAAEVPFAYRAQLALYRRMVQPLWPGRPVRALLVWTRGPRIVELDPRELDTAADAALAPE